MRHQHRRKCRFSFRQQQGQDAGEGKHTALHREVVTHEETIETQHNRIQTMQIDHIRQIWEIQQQHLKEVERKDTEHKKEMSRFTRLVEQLCTTWLPLAKKLQRMEKLCHLIGFDERQTTTLVSGRPLIYAGERYSEEPKKKFTTDKAAFQVVKAPTDKTKLVLAIERKPIAEWFKEQFEKLRQTIHRPIQPQRKSRGMKL